jgi:hypothetical protein
MWCDASCKKPELHFDLIQRYRTDPYYPISLVPSSASTPNILGLGLFSLFPPIGLVAVGVVAFSCGDDCFTLLLHVLLPILPPLVSWLSPLRPVLPIYSLNHTSCYPARSVPTLGVQLSPLYPTCVKELYLLCQQEGKIRHGIGSCIYARIGIYDGEDYSALRSRQVAASLEEIFQGHLFHDVLAGGRSVFRGCHTRGTYGV